MLALLLCTAALGQLVLGQVPQVTTSQGTMKGKILKSRGGRQYFSFTRIPYAKPPIEERRFMIPEKAENWTGILDATQDIPLCYQKNQLIPDAPIRGQEDCLYLNVFTPNITGKYPVILSIHGGGFNTGSARDFGTAMFFMDESVVFVAPNYRLGTLGFLSLEDNVIPGNMGLKDQALALEWIHKEISAFGGDPNLITVIGESAGGASSDIICSAPKTNGMIKGCISQSGNGWTPWAILKPGEARKMALNLVKAVGCTDKGLLKCLQDKPLELVGNISFLLDNSTRLLSTSPVLESVDAPGAILTSWPTAANQNYPWIIGVCQDDGMLSTGLYEYHLRSKEETDKFINTFNSSIISDLNLENKHNEFLRIWERFFNETEPLIAIRNFFTEYLFLNPTLVALNRHPGPTYFYNFNYTGGPQLFVGDNKAKGVGHAAEMPYFFETTSNTHDWPKLADIQLSKQLVKMWVNFTTNQTPNSQGMLQWPQFQGQYFLNIQNTGVSVGNFTQYQEIIGFWRSIIPDQTSKSSTIQSSLMFIAAFSIFTTFKTLYFKDV